MTCSTDVLDWLILATDGAADTIAALGVTWAEIAEMDNAALRALLEKCYDWEESTDPNGIAFPRAKRHDDKAIAAIRLR